MKRAKIVSFNYDKMKIKSFQIRIIRLTKNERK